MERGRDGSVAGVRDGRAGSSEAEAGDPAAAFEALRATVEGQGVGLGREMAAIRRGVEGALARFEEQGTPVDYGPDLGRIVQALGLVEDRLAAVERSPMLRQGPEHYARMLANGGESLVRAAAQGLERQTRDLGRVERQLSERLVGARERRRQDRWLTGVGGAAFLAGSLAGVLAVLVLPRGLPDGVGLSVAATVLGADRWDAGAALMRAGSAPGWQGLVEAHRLVQANREALTGCGAAAAKAGTEQRCTVVVPVPTP
ncbi:DUF6118 family protein [Methylobacterium sp. NEAU 140]|uniref:DUF6118 family protein n=1 Tax=Methylobacterium sp. NEAU 140 TaxID=3064945 RepID=UPI00273626A9|nr:DUF6118 family protein [Methylobacterium sp. NEAU 140]MDP4027230.1 DUF6118 family protein [Methylobacterium sp. NEAU 140]